jgi:hypothetical protein
LGLKWVVAHPAISLVTLLAAVLTLGFLFPRARPKLRREYGWALAAASAAVIVLYANVVFQNLLSPQFADHVEPQVAAVSDLLLNGKPLYPAPGAAEQYSLPYGPYSYLWVAGYYWIMGPSITAAKASSTVSALAGVALLLAACWRVAGWRAGLACAALSTAIYYRFNSMSYWCRADTHQIFLISLSVFALTLSNPWWAAILIGAAAGVDLNMKINSAVYAIPLATAFYLRHHKLAPLFVAGVIAAVVAAAPFASPAISLPNYLAWLRLASRHPFAVELPDTLAFSGWLAGLLLLIGLPCLYAGQTDKEKRRDWWTTAAAMGMAIVLTIPVAAKRGAGAHHLLPLVPFVCWLIAWAWSIAPAASPVINWRHIILLPIALMTLIYGADLGIGFASEIRTNAPSVRMVAADLENAMDRSPDRTIMMGVGSDANYWFTYMRPVLVFAGNPYPLDPAAAMDSSEDQNGLPQATTDLWKSSMPDYILIPKGDQPFTLWDWYHPDRPVFSQDFVRAFRKYYAPHFRARFFDVYVRKTLLGSPAPASRP